MVLLVVLKRHDCVLCSVVDLGVRFVVLMMLEEAKDGYQTKVNVQINIFLRWVDSLGRQRNTM